MGLETGTYINDLSSSNPTSTDLRSQGDDHIRLIKAVLQATFPRAGKAFRFPTASAKSADFTVASTDENTHYYVDVTAGNKTVTLPSLSASDLGWLVQFTKVDSSSNYLLLNANINGDADGFRIAQQYQEITLWWNGTAWLAFGGLPFNDIGSVLLANMTLTGLLTLSSTSHLSLAGGTTGQRPGSPAAKDFRFNTTTGLLEFYDGTQWLNPGGLPRGHLSGATISNATSDAVNDIHVASGTCRDYTNSVDMDIPSHTDKQLDANWTSGTSSSGVRNSAAGIANTSYGIFAARTVASRTATIYAAATMNEATALAALQAESGGASYAYIRRIGAILRESAALVLFEQVGDIFTRKTPSLDYNTTNPSGNVDVTLKVPIGIQVEAWGTLNQNNNDSSAAAVTLRAKYQNLDVSTSGPAHIITVGNSNAGAYWSLQTNTSGVIVMSGQNGSGSINNRVYTNGWVDRRGRDA